MQEDVPESAEGEQEVHSYVWAANSFNRLEKRAIELGEYDENLDQYQILSGLTEDDYIAWPVEGLYEGVATVTNIAEANWGEEIIWTENYEDEYFEEEYLETEDVEEE